VVALLRSKHGTLWSAKIRELKNFKRLGVKEMTSRTIMLSKRYLKKK